MGLCPLWPVLLIHCRKECLLCALVVQKRRHPHAGFLFNTQNLVHSGCCVLVSVYPGRFGCFESSRPSQALSFRAYMPLKCSSFRNSNISINLIYFLVNSIWLKRSCLKSFLKTLVENPWYLQSTDLVLNTRSWRRNPREWSDEPCVRSNKNGSPISSWKCIKLITLGMRFSWTHSGNSELT